MHRGAGMAEGHGMEHGRGGHGHGMHAGMGGMGGMGGMDGGMRMLRGLNLTGAQRDQVFSLMLKQAPAAREQGKAIQKARQELRTLAMSAQYDDARAKTLADSIAAATAQMALPDEQLGGGVVDDHESPVGVDHHERLADAAEGRLEPIALRGERVFGDLGPTAGLRHVVTLQPEALTIVAREHGRLDLVLMDIHMPGMSGYEATRRLRRTYDASELPIVALTAAALATEQARALAVGMNDFVPKPIDVDQLRTVVSRWLRQGV